MKCENTAKADPGNEWMTNPSEIAVVRQMKEDLDWAMEHRDQLEQQFPGESVVVWRGQVVAHGDNPEELFRSATSAERPREQLVLVELPIFFESPRSFQEE